jgi:hypothetical protein
VQTAVRFLTYGSAPVSACPSLSPVAFGTDSPFTVARPSKILTWFPVYLPIITDWTAATHIINYIFLILPYHESGVPLEIDNT